MEGKNINRITIRISTPTSIVESDEYMSTSEVIELLKYLHWMRTTKYGTFEAIRYNGDKGASFIDTTQSERIRNPIFTFDIIRDGRT